MIKDFLLDDERLMPVVDQIRKEFPRLPDGAEFATYIQQAHEQEINGIWQAVPEAAVFVIQVPNPRRPILPKAHRGTWPLHAFRVMESSYDRLVGYPDPVLVAFRQIAPNAISWHETMRDISDPVEGDWSGKTGIIHGAD